MKHLLSFSAVLIAASLGGCGGGSGSKSDSSNSLSAATAPLTFTPGVLTASYAEGSPAKLELVAKRSATIPSNAYFKATADGGALESRVDYMINYDGRVFFEPHPLATAKAGHYTGTITVTVCLSEGCGIQAQGSPFKLPYEIDVVPAQGKVTAFNLSPLSALAGAGDWGTFQANAAHTGYVPVTLNATAFNPRWKMYASAINGILREPSAVTTGGGRLYTAYGFASNGVGVAFTALNESDGSTAWNSKFADGSLSRTNPPGYANGKVYGVAGAQENTAMYAFDAVSGAQLFTSKMSSQWPRYMSPTVYGDNVYSNGGAHGGLYAINGSTGALKYFKVLPDYDGWTPAIDGQVLYAYVEGKLKVMDAATGSERASISDPAYKWSGYTSKIAPVIGNGGLVFAGNLGDAHKNEISAFDTAGNTVRWSTEGAYSGNPAYADGTLFAADNQTARLAAFNESNGSIAWSWPCPDGESFVSDVLLTKNLVFVSTDAATYAIDRNSHKQVWTYRASGSLALSANGILYIKGRTSITAINLH